MPQNNKKLITFFISVFIIGFSYWYFFVDTLMFTEITGQPQNPMTTILVNLFDFDTGLTRYDVYNLASKSGYWEKRTQKIHSIRNPQKREIENNKLLAEMMQDPSIKKIAKKVMGFGGTTAMSIFKAANTFKF